MSFRYKIIQKDGREHKVTSDLPARIMIEQEKRAGELKKMFLFRGREEDIARDDDPNLWTEVYPDGYY